MSVRIGFARLGGKKKPFYRIVAANIEAKRDGRFLDILGTYDPRQDPAAVKIDVEKLNSWLAKGARPTTTVKSLIAKQKAASAVAVETAE